MVNHHISASKSCSRERLNDFIRKDNPSTSPSPKRQRINKISVYDGGSQGDLADLEYNIGIGDDFEIPSPPREASVEGIDMEGHGGGAGGDTYQTNERFIEPYSGEAGNGLRHSKTQFEYWLENQWMEEKFYGTHSQAYRNGH